MEALGYLLERIQLLNKVVGVFQRLLIHIFVL